MTADAIVVLGAPVHAPAEPSPAMRRRVVHGIRTLQAGRAPALVLSGGAVRGMPAEAAVMAAVAREHGVTDERIVIEDRSRNTFENALYTGRIMRDRGWRRIVVVTDPFHMPRALFVFRRLGLAAEGEPVPERGDGSRWYWYGAYVRESIALARSAWLFLIGRHRPLVEAVWGS